ncbi:ATP-binding cassette sub-family G member 2 [Strongyloides ratti]|uniref:ATP-binding cassette sub-family G member 2 n=1 Tax=Strongyloides ratti TaxID=34506 RepID=A0A090MY60_STRRB|nr:ATP-binding cassette sub-family G member 2 [Strongyloides ratti]CEF66619.1 ATP-binding cassette sub-family G member 2 [Strongyloides ratti]
MSVNGNTDDHSIKVVDESSLLDNDELDQMSRSRFVDDEVMSFFSGIRQKQSTVLSKSSVVPSMKLSWHDINSRPSQNIKTSKGKKVDLSDEIIKKRPYILKDVFGVAEPGEVLAIMGASGAGKTSLLNILTQQNLSGLALSGKIKINDVEVDGQLLRKLSAYVQQTDLFIGSMTVEEHLKFVAKLKMGRNYTTEEIDQKVSMLLDELGLTKCAKNLIGWPHKQKGISGGERKRLAFASEIITAPPLLFCDEPTSGLDSFLAQQVVQVLKKLASKNRMTIVVTIHQPSSQVFEMFDKILFMAEGRVGYFGTISGGINFWKNIGLPVPPNFNPSDHFINTLAIKKKQELKCQKEVKKICDTFQNSDEGKNLYNKCIGKKKGSTTGIVSFNDLLEVDEKLKNNASFKYESTYSQQMIALIKRSFLVTLREPMLLKVRLFQSILIAVILGLVYFQTPVKQATVMNINGVLFQAVSNLNFMFQFVIVYIMCDELPIFLREHHSSLYRVDTYFLAKNIADIPQFILYPVTFSVILYWMVGLYSNIWTFLIFIITGTLVTNVAISIGYMAACLFRNVGVAVAVMPIFTIPMLAFSGFYINIRNLPWYFSWMRYFSYFGYAFETMAINEWINYDSIEGCIPVPETNITIPHNCYMNGYEVLQDYDFEVGHEFRNIFLMIALNIIFRLIAFVALYKKSKAYT